MNKPTLFLMLGYPGAGKTTAADHIARLTGAVHLSSDRLRLELFPSPIFSQAEHDQLYGVLDQKTEELLAAGHDVIYDANLNRLQHRAEKYAICKRVNATPLLIWVQAATELAKERAGHQSRAKLWRHDERPDQMFDRLVGVFEEPTEDEKYLTMDGTKITSDYVRDCLGI